MNRYIISNITSYDISDPIAKQFKYQNCIGSYEDTRHTITAITFDISYFGRYKHTLKFLFPLTIKGAIEKAEECLSQPLSREYYDKIQNDLLYNAYDYDKAIKLFTNRGDCLTGKIFLERIVRPYSNAHHIYLDCGS